ncbi:von Willebrand factor A domain-containing protein 5A-like isoform X2 [Argopecten irradians]|uniref:von Willebrand factor A domain-containing protein 5A-like isoform X2 n=1 Tax=Argopecten irradians TaxID=31199 RepID=UPI00371F6975
MYGLRIQHEVGASSQDKAGVLPGSKTVPLKSVGVDVTIKGFVANVQSTLTYENQKEVAVETVFVFPIDDQSAVYQFEADIDGRHIVAECQDKEQARETYKDALKTGHTAMLLSESDTSGDVFECKLGNLPPHGAATLTFSYVTELTTGSEGIVTFTLPTVLNPRYTPPGFEMSPPSSDAIHYTDIQYQIRFVTKVEGQHLIKAIVPKMDMLKVDLAEDKKSANVTLDDTTKFKFDHDLSLTLEYEDVFQPTVILEKGQNSKEGFLKSDVVMMDFLPDLRSVPELIEAEFVFVIDCSASMRGDRIAKAKETVLLLLKSLPVGCFFNVVAFGSSFEWWFTSSMKYDENSLEEALKLQKVLDANLGGTEILRPLESLYAQPLHTAKFRQVFLLTDGDVSNTNQVITLARKNATNTRIFTFGIGEGASTSLVRNVAKVTNGLATFVTDKEKLQNKVMTVLNHAMQQPVTNLNLEWNLPPGCTAINIPQQAPVVFKGQKVITYALINGVEHLNEDTQCSAVLKGDIGKENSIHYTLNFDLMTVVKSDDSFPVHRLAAKTQIKDFETAGDDSKKGEITLLSMSSNVVSRYTAFVGVDKDKKELVDGGRLVKRPYFYGYLPMGYAIAWGDDAYDHIYESTNYGSDKSDRKSKANYRRRGFSFSLGSMVPDKLRNLFSRKSKRKSVSKDPSETSRRADSMDNMAECMDEADDCMALNSKELIGDSRVSQDDRKLHPSSIEHDGTSGVMTLIDLQKFDGSWVLDRELAKAVRLSEDFLKSKLPDNLDTSVWATAVGVACLQKKFGSEKTLWELIEKKALAWMSSQNLAGKTVSELVTLARDVLSTPP